jgi:hypothetical protein
VESRVTGMSRLAAAGAIVVIAAGVAGCASGGSPAGKPGTTSTAAAAQTPEQAIELAASAARDINSFTATMSIQGSTGSSGSSSEAFDLAGTISEQNHPSLLEEADYSTFSAAGQTIPGGMSEIVNSSSLYMKLAILTQELHTTKPWIEIPFSALTKASGVDISSLFGQLETNSPVDQSQLFAGAENVKVGGAGVVDGVPVTEYTGTVSMSMALGKLPASLRTTFGQDIEKASISSVRFTEWVDSQHQVRKTTVTESGSAVTETITTTITSLNQPVNIQVPPPSQTTPFPASLLNSL